MVRSLIQFSKGITSRQARRDIGELRDEIALIHGGDSWAPSGGPYRPGEAVHVGNSCCQCGGDAATDLIGGSQRSVGVEEALHLDT